MHSVSLGTNALTSLGFAVTHIDGMVVSPAQIGATVFTQFVPQGYYYFLAEY